jgi:hypothetical protein
MLSQFAGAAVELDEALIVNPHETDGVAAALKRGWRCHGKSGANATRRCLHLLKERHQTVVKILHVDARRLEERAQLARSYAPLAQAAALAKTTSARCSGGENTRGPNFSKISGFGRFRLNDRRGTVDVDACDAVNELSFFVI